MCTGGGGQAPCGRPHRKLNLESTDVILCSSHEKKLVYFFKILYINLPCLLACLNSCRQGHVYILANKSARGAIGAMNRDIWRSQMQPHTQTLTIWRSQMQPHIH